MVSQKRRSPRAIATLFSNLTEHPYQPPAYTLGDKVIWHYINDDETDLKHYGKSYILTGFITGSIWCAINRQKGWSYQVHWIEDEGYNLLKRLPGRDVFEEKYLKPYRVEYQLPC